MAEIVWDKRAKNSLKKQIDYIKEDSLKAAENVLEDLLFIVDNLPSNPKKFPKDKFRKNNDGNFRAFEKHNIRIAYLITTKNIRILRVRHIKQEPRFY